MRIVKWRVYIFFSGDNAHTLIIMKARRGTDTPLHTHRALSRLTAYLALTLTIRIIIKKIGNIKKQMLRIPNIRLKIVYVCFVIYSIN